MIQFTWLQSRVQAAVAIAGLVVVAIGLAVSGAHLAHLYDTIVATCAARGDCSAVTTTFLRNDSSLRTGLGVLVVVIPGVIGIFLGAPLVARELEAGTFRLVWTQSVTRTRWLAVKVGSVGLVAMATAGLLSLMVTWWASPLDRAHMTLFATFDQRGVVPVGYAAFAFTFGVIAGVLLRRTVPAMATTMVVFVAARLAVNHLVRPDLIAPAHLPFVLDPVSTGFGSSGSLFFGSGPDNLQPSPPAIPNAWITSTRIVGRAGHTLTSQVLKSYCPSIGGGGGGSPGGVGLGGSQSRTEVPVAAQTALQNCVAKVGATYHGIVTYQPANRYWAFQWYELAMYLAAALVLTGLSIWWVRNRLS